MVVDFYADWCGPCKKIAPVFAALADKYRTKAVFLKVNSDTCKDVAMSAGIKAIPTFIFFHNGSTIETLQGPSPGDLEGRVEQYTKKYSLFSGTGHSLTGSSGASPAAPASSGAAPRRRNPWADPNVSELVPRHVEELLFHVIVVSHSCPLPPSISLSMYTHTRNLLRDY